jgi:hypothetical protein
MLDCIRVQGFVRSFHEVHKMNVYSGGRVHPFGSVFRLRNIQMDFGEACLEATVKGKAVPVTGREDP